MKKYRQKRLDLVGKTSMKTRNYIFSLPREKGREN